MAQIHVDTECDSNETLEKLAHFLLALVGKPLTAPSPNIEIRGNVTVRGHVEPEFEAVDDSDLQSIFGKSEIPKPVAGAGSTAGAAASGIVPEVPTLTEPVKSLFARTDSPVPPVPAAAVPSVPAPTGERDSEGTPWDERIHQVGKGKLVNGTWKLKKGIDKDYAAIILAEIKGKLPASVVIERIDAPPPVPAVPNARDFAALMPRFTAYQTMHKLSLPQLVEQLLAPVGVKAPSELLRPEHKEATVGALHNTLDLLGVP